MNSKSPGDSPSTFDVELQSLRTENEPSERYLLNGIKPQVTALDVSNSDDDEDDEDGTDDGTRALLGSQHASPSVGHATGQTLTKLWPQIRGIVLECAPTLLFTTIGLLFTGKLLDQVSQWKAMKQVDQLIMIIPVVLNLKGNLEMNLSARLGTAANVGELDDPETRKTLIMGNLSLLQVQATVVSFVAACVSLVLGMIVPRSLVEVPSSTPNLNATLLRRRPFPKPPPSGERKSGFPTFVMVASTAMTSACLSSLLLGSFMCALVVLCRLSNRDPDNIAPPIASCLGDLVTLCFIGLVSVILINFISTPIPLVIVIIIIISAGICLASTRRNPLVRDLLTQGWLPLFGAMIISSGTGIVLDLFVTKYEGFALLAVVISGLPGSVGSIFVSRLSTSLHAAALSRSTSNSSSSQTTTPHPRIVMFTLLTITIPVELIFLAILRGFGWLKLPFLFLAFSVMFFCCAVYISLLLAQLLTNYLWSKNLDPDMYALPIQSALMDLIGQLLLVLCFELVQALGGRVSMHR